MKPHKTAIERAFELAKSGQVERLTDLKKALSCQGYVVSQIEGPSLLRQLRKALRTARHG
jgi:hypothetical protein